MFDVKKIEINAAFYELFESTFGEDFFNILASLRQSPRIIKLRAKKEDTLTEAEKEELFQSNLKMAGIMKKQSARIAYIGWKLAQKNYTCSYEDYLGFLADNCSAVFQDAEVIKEIWDKVTQDQAVPTSVKNA